MIDPIVIITFYKPQPGQLSGSWLWRISQNGVLANPRQADIAALLILVTSYVVIGGRMR